MNLLTAYTTPQEVRATLGVSSTELTDATLSLPIYVTHLEIELEEINPLVFTQMARISSIQVPDAPTALEAKFLATAKMFSAYAVAKHMLVSLPLFSVETLEDGKALFTRFNEAYADIKEGVEGMYSKLKYRLGLLLQQLEVNPVVVPEYIASLTSVTSTLAVDPVTDAT